MKILTKTTTLPNHIITLDLNSKSHRNSIIIILTRNTNITGDATALNHNNNNDINIRS